MALTFPDDDTDDGFTACINTTPLVDVMLVLLIIFLITVPVVTHSIALDLPKEASRPTIAAPRDVTIAVDRDGAVFWDQDRLADGAALDQRLRAAAAQVPPPGIHLRGDRFTRYHHVGAVVAACKRAGLVKIGFVTEPPAGATP